MSIRFSGFYQLNGPMKVVEQAKQRLKALAEEQHIPLQDYILSTQDKTRQHPDPVGDVHAEHIRALFAQKTKAELADLAEKLQILSSPVFSSKENDDFEAHLIATGKNDVETLNRCRQAQIAYKEAEAENWREYYRKVTQGEFKTFEEDEAYRQNLKPEKTPLVKQFNEIRYQVGQFSQKFASEILQKLDAGKTFNLLTGKFN